MKKLMIAMAVVALAAVSQAASFQWTASGVKGYNTTDLYSGTATIYAYLSTDATKTIIFTDTATMTGGAIDKVIEGDFTDGSKYKFYYTMTDAAGDTFKSATKTVTAQAKSTPGISFLSSGSWTAAPVPEPTSAMFLLLGVAGLALKRRRA